MHELWPAKEVSKSSDKSCLFRTAKYWPEGPRASPPSLYDGGLLAGVPL